MSSQQRLANKEEANDNIKNSKSIKRKDKKTTTILNLTNTRKQNNKNKRIGRKDINESRENIKNKINQRNIMYNNISKQISYALKERQEVIILGDFNA